MSKPDPAAQPATAASRTARIDAVHEMLCVGLSREQIAEFVTTKLDWNVPPRTLESYLAEAEARFRQAFTVHRELEAGRALTRLHDLYARSMKAQDYKTCLAVQKEINTLLDLYPGS